MESTAGQFVSFLGPTTLNELRVQYARRVQSRTANELSGTGPAITITGIANFGGPIATATTPASASCRASPRSSTTSRTSAATTASRSASTSSTSPTTARQALLQLYTFPTVAAYLAARNGTNPRSYTNFQQVIGDPNFEMKLELYSVFIQDDWRVTPNLKLLYGFRYDYYNYPEGDPNAPFLYSQNYTDDNNNFGPRVGVAWTLGAKKDQVIRASTGIMYDQPLLAAYENAIQQNGLPARTTVNVAPAAAGAPAFPNTLVEPAAGPRCRAESCAVDPDFKLACNIQNNVQYERALGRNFNGSVGLHYCGLQPAGHHQHQSDQPGRAAGRRPGDLQHGGQRGTRLDPRFNQINVVQSLGESTYKALMLQFGKRLSGGVQFDLNYTLGKGTDKAPLHGATLSVQGDDGVGDPTNLERDRGPNVLDTRHSFNGSIVASRRFGDRRDAARSVSDNQVGDHPAVQHGPAVQRAQRTGPERGRHARRSAAEHRPQLALPAGALQRRRAVVALHPARRHAPRRDPRRVQEHVQHACRRRRVNRIIPTNALGEPTRRHADSSDQLQPTAGYEQRQFQLGFKFYF